jgi:hypothetical protein
MPAPMMPQAGGAPPGAPPPQPGNQPPFGTTPVTGPSPNKGYEAQALQQLGLIVKRMAEILPLVGATSEIGQAVMKSMQSLAKHVPAGASNNVAERNTLEKMALQNRQNGEMQQQLQQRMMQGGGGGQPAAMPPGGMPGIPRAA